MKVKKLKKFPCECGKSYDTGKEFSDHTRECSVDPVEWGKVESEVAVETSK